MKKNILAILIFLTTTIVCHATTNYNMVSSNTEYDRSSYTSPDSLLLHLVVPGRLGDAYYKHLSDDYCTDAFRRLVIFSEDGVSQVVEMTKGLIGNYRVLYDDPLTPADKLKASLDSCNLYMETLSFVNRNMTGRNDGVYVLKTNVQVVGSGYIRNEEYGWAIRDTTLCIYGIYSKEYIVLGLDMISERLGCNWGYDDSKLTFSLYPDDGYKIGNTLVNNYIDEVKNSKITVYLDYKTTLYAEFVPNEETSVETSYINSTPLLINQDDRILTVTGLYDGETVTAYSADGQEVAKTKAIGDAALLNLSNLQGKVAVLSVGGKSAKVIIKK